MPENVLQQAGGRAAAADTAAADTSQLFHAPLYTDGFPAVAAADSAAAPLGQTPAMKLPPGEPAAARGQSLVHDTGAMSLLLASLFFLAVSYSTGYKYIESLLRNMFSVRRQESLFDDSTVKETQILSALVMLTCTLEGILLYQLVSLLHPELSASMQRAMSLHVVLLVGVAVAFYLLQLGLFGLLGYVFTDSDNSRVWLDGFKSSQSLLGLALLPLVALSLAVPSTVKITLIAAAILYFSARVVFICKGFRIFFSNLLSLLYFILYLCAAEIVPLALVYGATLAICQHLQS